MMTDIQFKSEKAMDKEEEYEVLTLFLAMKKLLNLVNENGCKNVMFDNVIVNASGVSCVPTSISAMIRLMRNRNAPSTSVTYSIMSCCKPTGLFLVQVNYNVWRLKNCLLPLQAVLFSSNETGSRRRSFTIFNYLYRFHKNMFHVLVCQDFTVEQ